MQRDICCGEGVGSAQAGEQIDVRGPLTYACDVGEVRDDFIIVERVERVEVERVLGYCLGNGAEGADLGARLTCFAE